MLKSSQECLTFGLFSLVTLIGIPFAIMAMATRGEGWFPGFCCVIALLSLIGFPFAAASLVTSAKAHKFEKNLWNAAKPFRMVGGICVIANFVATFLVALMVGFLIANAALFGN